MSLKYVVKIVILTFLFFRESFGAVRRKKGKTLQAQREKDRSR